MAGGRRFGVKGRKIVYVKEWEIESGDNMVTSWYTGSRIWREIELVARGDKRYIKICRWIWYVLKDEELDKDTSREVDSEWGFRKTINISDSWLHH